MWYFAWILGTGLAALAGVLNGMWFEAREPGRSQSQQ
ncbi:cytochrome bd-I oxidase subunit CydX [Xanthomonas sp. 3075]|nr:cytochrome bd-I oxidase subunit CydX [Xanthomonas sp. 3075]MBB4131625.1 cyd operon protein YbgT [Xanthomonas sp. 3075]